MVEPSGQPDEASMMLDRFQLDEREALVLSVGKLHLMAADARDDPDEEDRAAKRPVVRSYTRELLGTFPSSPQGYSARTKSDVLDLVGQPDWVREVEQALGDMDPKAASRLMQGWTLTARMLAEVSERERALLLLIELLSFFPWSPGVKFERDVRMPRIKKMASAMRAPVGPDDVEELDHALVKSLRRLSHREIAWGKVALLGASAAAIGGITGGLAAPALGTLIGSTYLGLSGAAATSAGLALLGGGSLAAGGMGMAGGTALIAAIAGLVGGGAGIRAGYLLDRRPQEVLAESSKLDVLAEYVVLREQGDPRVLGGWAEALDGVLASPRSEDAAAEVSREAHEKWLGHMSALATQQMSSLVKQLDSWGILDRLREHLLHRLVDFTDGLKGWIAEADVPPATGPEGTMLIEARIAEGLGGGMRRASSMIPALIVNEQDEPVLGVMVKVLQGKEAKRGKDVADKLAIKRPLSRAAVAAGIDIVAHPLTWAMVGAAAGTAATAHATGAAAVLGTVKSKLGASAGPLRLAGGFDLASIFPGEELSTVAQRHGLDLELLGRELTRVIVREARETYGGAVLDLAEGLRLQVGEVERKASG